MASSDNHGPLTSKLRVSHSFSTKYISTLNERLSEEHRSLIVETPFQWFLDFDLVYHYLVRGLYKALDALKKGKGTCNVYVDGCVYILQVWFCENFSPPKGPIEKFPRILHWMKINLGDNFVKGVMETGVVHHDVDVGVSVKDKKDEKDDQPRPKMKDDQPTPKRRVVVLESKLAEEKARRRNKDDGGQSVPREELSMNTGFFPPGGMSINPPSMKTYVRIRPRRRYKSRVLRTPYTGFVRIKYE
ncbi:hypothetical protein LR48_Vigan277s000200 [Vigna angularis]|uniref:Aminotransferase-like plant mobile domain-containing protein n=1 Tax=Phaseolus angularis TaxID=3914 RepID=A0A0L9T7D1_PHAAN|nr:hypothetical protein LR48_Vigan277s000200 [Vigna angularis]